MGLDLTLLPLDHDTLKWGYSHTVIPAGWARELHDPIHAMPRTPVPEDFTTYMGTTEDGERGYGQTKETPYGSPLDCVTVAQLLTLAKRKAVRDSPRNRAAWAFLSALDPSTRIALWWH